MVFTAVDIVGKTIFGYSFSWASLLERALIVSWVGYFATIICSAGAGN